MVKASSTTFIERGVQSFLSVIAIIPVYTNWRGTLGGKEERWRGCCKHRWSSGYNVFYNRLYIGKSWFTLSMVLYLHTFPFLHFLQI